MFLDAGPLGLVTNGERWTLVYAELDKPTGTYTWIPFGGGQRHCIGRSFATLEIKVVLRTLALQARFAPSEQPDEEITLEVLDAAGIRYDREEVAASLRCPVCGCNIISVPSGVDRPGPAPSS